MRFLLLIAFCLLSAPAIANEQTDVKDTFRATGYPLPRFVSIASDKVHVRTGPGKKYPIEWVFRRKELPVEIILEFENWRKIKDHEGGVGWLHKSLLTGRRTVLVAGEEQVSLYRKPQKDSPLAAYLEPSVLARVKLCDGVWCSINAAGFKGWALQENLWGVYPNEVIED